MRQAQGWQGRVMQLDAHPGAERFKGRSTSEALGLARQRFGPECLILDTRACKSDSTRQPGAWVEVIAAPERPTPRDAAPMTNPRPCGVPEHLHALYMSLTRERVADDIARQLVARIQAEPAVMPGALTEKNVANAPDAESIRRQFRGFLEAMLPTADSTPAPQPGKCKVVAIIGPVGAGKTTTAAKLASQWTLRHNLSVGLITLDCVRPGAAQQLEAYAAALDAPCRTAYDRVELQKALNDLGACDAVIIDTPGVGPRDDDGMRRLGDMLDAAAVDETHLVLPGTHDSSYLVACTTRFRALGFSRAVFSKLDEAIGFGVIVDCLRKAGAALSYVTTGRNVVDDLEPADPAALADLILTGVFPPG